MFVMDSEPEDDVTMSSPLHNICATSITCIVRTQAC